VLSDGDGNPLISTADNQTVALEGAVPNSGTGITFPATQSASSNANTLDDYEEGTFTPTATGSTTSGTTTYQLQVGHYTKIGRIVNIVFIVDYTAMTGTGDIVVGGLPFNVANLSENYVPGSIVVSGLNWGGGSMISPLAFPNTNNVYFYYQSDDGGAAPQQCVNEAVNFRVSLTYFA
jgi:hypothetical protein